MSGVRLFRHKVTSIGCGTLLSLAQWLASTYQYRKDTFFKTCSFIEYFISKPLKDHYHNHQSSCAGWQWGVSSCQRTTQGQVLKERHVRRLNQFLAPRPNPKLQFYDIVQSVHHFRLCTGWQWGDSSCQRTIRVKFEREVREETHQFLAPRPNPKL